MNNLRKVVFVTSLCTSIALLIYFIYAIVNVEELKFVLGNGNYIMSILFLSLIFASISFITFIKIRKI